LTEWAAIEGTFTRLRDFVFADLEQLVRQNRGGNFAVVALVMAACDALGSLHYGKDQGHRIFERCLTDEWKPAADTLFDALRHGLVHRYETQAVVVEGKPVGFEIAWAGERHLSFADERREVLCIVAPLLVKSLRLAFDGVEAELRRDGAARDEFLARDRKGRQIHPRGPVLDRWRLAVNAARIVPRPLSGPVGATGGHRPARTDEEIGEGATGPKF
jgi:hypothetical protein